MVRFQYIRSVVFWAIVALFFSTPLWSQAGFQFGQNKVQYKNFDWQVFRTEHFDVHYYPEMEASARDAARMAERGYAYLSQVLNHQIKERIPLILYASMNDFQQTNTVQSMIGSGTRGVTESLKKRVILPMTGSYREFNHVLVHELVHAFQYDIIFAKEGGNRRFNPPLWFIEGMAEYLSINLDNTTRMWMRDGLEHDKLLSIDQLNRAGDIRVYRLGESVFHYVGAQYGKAMIGNLLKDAVQTGSVEQAFKKNLSKDNKQLTEAWHANARQIALPADSALFQSPEAAATQLTSRENFYHRMNLTPAVSPDGNSIAYISNEDLNEDIYLLTRNAQGEWENHRLVSGGSSRQFEALGFFETAIGWSPDGRRIAFVSKSGKDDAIYIMDPFSGKELQKLVFSELNGLLSPTFSPDGTRLAFVGISGGVSDLYVVDLHNEALTRLTSDRFTEYHPQWSPEGQEIAFVTDRGPGSDEARLLFGDYDLALYDLNRKTVRLLTHLPGDVTNPQWSPDAREIAFISEHQGIPNIYLLELASGRIDPVTHLLNGVSGITATTPAFSWSGDGSTLVFSAFDDGSWQLYRLDLNNLLVDLAARRTIPLEARNMPTPPAIAGSDTASGRTVTVPATPAPVMTPTAAVAATVSPDTLWLPALTDQTALYANYNLVPEDSIEARDYSRKFKLDAVGVGGGYDTYWGASGGAQFLFSDMLGNHNLYITSALRFSDPRFMDASVTYFNQARRLNFGVQLYQQSYRYLIGANFTQLGQIRNTYRGFNALAAYPFSRFARVELSAGMTRVDQDFLLETYSLSGIKRDTQDIGAFSFAQAGGALVFDNTVYGYIGPLSGSRSRFSLETTAGDLEYNTAFADYRHYFKISSRSTLAWRLMGGSNWGKDPQFFSIGGPFGYRGADYNELYGTNFFLSNLEYRFPLIPFLPANADLLSGAAFVDAAGAWGDGGYTGLQPNTFRAFSSEGGLRFQDLNAAVGVGARMNFGFILMKYDLAWPTDLQKFGAPVGLFSIGTFF